VFVPLYGRESFSFGLTRSFDDDNPFDLCGPCGRQGPGHQLPGHVKLYQAVFFSSDDEFRPRLRL
jgi:hypothetical protein